jgi:hypothetical protein
MFSIQPQRPVRSTRVRADENVPPVVIGQKSIHQRNKSSPALSAMLGAAALKAPAKRTAFGDVSNTVNGARLTKDDGASSLKQGIQVKDKDKPVPVVADKKTTTFLRQATRPYSVSNLRGLLSGVNGITATEPSLKAPPLETILLANARKPLTKRQTATTNVFKDTTLPAPRETASELPDDSRPATISNPATQASSLPELSFTANIADALQPQAIPASDASLDDTEKSSMQPSTASSDVGESAALRSDGIYIDENGNVQIYQEVQPEPEHETQKTHLASKPTYTRLTRPEACPTSTTDALPASYASVAHIKPHSQLPPRAEPEEYWEEEEDENYEEEDYVTARSFRSRGENTTGGATTVLFPLVTQKVKREIEAATQLVEAERTPEEIEDECFDTSMVAEYGDEIFDYMRNLEVNEQRRLLTLNADILDRSRCCQTLTIWTTRRKSNGRCALSLWIGLFKSTIDSIFCPKRCFLPSTISTDSYPARSFLSASYSW